MSRKCACVTFARVVRHKRPPRGSTLHSPAVSCSRKRTLCGGFVCFAEIFEAMCPVDHMHDSGELFTTLLDLSPDCGVSVRCFLVLRGEWLEETNRSTFGRAIRRIGEVRVKSLRKSTRLSNRRFCARFLTQVDEFCSDSLRSCFGFSTRLLYDSLSGLSVCRVGIARSVVEFLAFSPICVLFSDTRRFTAKPRRYSVGSGASRSYGRRFTLQSQEKGWTQRFRVGWDAGDVACKTQKRRVFRSKSREKD